MSNVKRPEHDGDVHFVIEGGVARITFDRPDARNAMTWAMYERLHSICERLREDPAVRVVRFQGAGGEAFVAGTDIAQFQDFDGEKGIAYERQIDATMQLMAGLPMPTVAVVQGWCIGGGLAIASFMGAGSLPVLRRIMQAADGHRPAARVHPMVDVRAGAQLMQRAGWSDPVADGRTQLALVVETARLDAVRPDREGQHGMAMRALLEPLDLVQVPSIGDEARDIDTWSDLRDIASEAEGH